MCGCSSNGLLVNDRMSAKPDQKLKYDKYATMGNSASKYAVSKMKKPQVSEIVEKKRVSIEKNCFIEEMEFIDSQEAQKNDAARNQNKSVKPTENEILCKMKKIEWVTPQVGFKA